MKKKIKDLTLEEAQRICDKMYRCSRCPLFNKYRPCIIRRSECNISIYEYYLEKEVEVDE